MIWGHGLAILRIELMLSLPPAFSNIIDIVSINNTIVIILNTTSTRTTVIINTTINDIVNVLAAALDLIAFIPDATMNINFWAQQCLDPTQ